MPLWSINNTFYDWSDIPPDYTLDRYTFSLKIQNATLEMNNTSFQCFVEESSSTIGLLTVHTVFSSIVSTEFLGKFKYLFIK